ncbi:outer membrane beta-barrel protein [Pseudoalteromonas luteoviolacea]|uniref:outer membrane beta-barrel protein n=1 Tax=Pseudoalteromonas luteoviolacea TaxID=43657 RepID=UPI0011515290|nr:outer membrane beta-barrel protein [Pseudoalteromonas luteoviolacea]TQF67790.1 outer membrane beta-barrel protein [Pseudoalteromonas luteoviolacea]
MKQSLLALSIALLSGNAIANDAFNFDYVGAGYGKIKIDDSYSDESFNGFAIEASKKINDSWVISAQYLNTSRDYTKQYYYHRYTGAEVTGKTNVDLDVEQFNLGAAYLIELDESSVLELAAHIGRLNLESTTMGEELEVLDNVESVTSYAYGGKAHNSTYGLNVNYHYAFSDSFTAEAGIGYERINDAEQENEFVYQLGLNYNITPDFTISALYRNVDVYQNHQVTLRYNF